MTDIENEAIKELNRLTEMTDKWFYSYYEYKDLQNYLKIVLNLVDRQEKQLQCISDEFLKYDWKNSTKEQIINQLRDLYNSIFRGGVLDDKEKN